MLLLALGRILGSFSHVHVVAEAKLRQFVLEVIAGHLGRNLMPVKLSRIFTIDSNQFIVSHLLNDELLLGCPELFLPSFLPILELLV